MRPARFSSSRTNIEEAVTLAGGSVIVLGRNPARVRRRFFYRNHLIRVTANLLRFVGVGRLHL